VVQPYLNLLFNCSNLETLECAACSIHNLAAFYWQPSIDLQAAVRKEKRLPILFSDCRPNVYTAQVANNMPTSSEWHRLQLQAFLDLNSWTGDLDKAAPPGKSLKINFIHEDQQY
jgi:hypothetical protein